MPKKIPPLLPDISSWHAELFRVTAFTLPDVGNSSGGSWEAVVGSTPESRTVQPRQGIVQESGPFLDGVLTLNASPLRTDWLLGTNFEKSDEGLPAIGSLTKVVEPFIRAVEKWLISAPATKRLAWGAVLLQEVSTRIDGYNLLGKYLHHVELDPEGSTDFLYSINRPRPSNILTGGSFNRLTRWSVTKMQALSMQVQLSSNAAPTALLASSPQSEIHACRLELDISTPAERNDALPAEMLQPVLGELVGLGLEIAGKGDIK